MTITSLLDRIKHCTVCKAHLPLGPRPVLRAHPNASILIIGQAPGTKVHASGIPWDDPSGKRLREWMGVSDDMFYDGKKIAIMPMGFCYPGKGSSGDLPPRPECAPLWHDKILAQLPNIKLTLLIGQYAHERYLGKLRKATLTETVRSWEDYIKKGYVPLVHPSPRNGIWLKRNPWFEKEVVLYLKKQIAKILKQ